jgi:homoserine O-succinyltransferase
MVLAIPRAFGRDGARLGSQGRPVRLGIVNIMPRAETYEPYLLAPLERSLVHVNVIWIRLRSHGYGSSDLERIERDYVDFERAIQHRPLDGLMVTGAPVEELRFHEVHYWNELSAILRASRTDVASTLGLCWGGMALAKQIGIDKYVYPKKLFGVFPHRNLVPGHPLLGGGDDVFWCAQSRHSGVRDDDIEAAEKANLLVPLAHGAAAGHTIFESSGGRYVMHLGHPEYEAERIAEEWERDRAQGRSDVEAPRSFDLAAPVNVWRSHRNDFFSQWLRRIAAGGERGGRAT